MYTQLNDIGSYPVNEICDGSPEWLNLHTPCGLFRSYTGNKYIIVPDLRTKIAIALVHDHLPPFTWQQLQTSPLDDGMWCGDFSLDPGHALARSSSKLMAGIVATGDGYASIDCCSLSGKLNAIALGHFGKKGSDFHDYDGWIVRPSKADIAFFKRSPDGRR